MLSLDEMEPRFNVLFQDETPFFEIRRIWNDINIAAKRLIETDQLEEEVRKAQAVGIIGGVREKHLIKMRERNETRGFEALISDSGSSDDIISKRSDDIVRSVRKICEPFHTLDQQLS